MFLAFPVSGECPRTSQGYIESKYLPWYTEFTRVRVFVLICELVPVGGYELFAADMVVEVFEADQGQDSAGGHVVDTDRGATTQAAQVMFGLGHDAELEGFFREDTYTWCNP